MKKIYYIIIIGMISFSFSCSNNNKKDNSKNEINLKLDDIEGEWTHSVDVSKTGEPDGTEYYLYLYVKTNTVRYYPCYDDCAYEGTYKYEYDKVYIECSNISDNTDPTETSKLNVTFTYKDGKLISDNGEEYIRISDKVAFEEVEENDTPQSNDIQNENNPHANLTVDVVGKIIDNMIFYTKKDDYYITYEFELIDIDDIGATLKCKYTEFIVNQNYGLTPMEILKQSANEVTYLTVNKGIVMIKKNNVNKPYILVEQIRGDDLIKPITLRFGVLETSRGKKAYVSGQMSDLTILDSKVKDPSRIPR
ncbi:MAG: hypothetical protein E6767_07940 [Dysgonomonas sp.]|nr:hypothetical protein [Dysgonomonas sp.]